MMSAWQTSIQRAGARAICEHRHFGAVDERRPQELEAGETRVTRLKKPMTSSERPEARNHADSVSKIRK